MISRPEFLTIGMLSKATGCNIDTIRYYEKIGLLSEPDRTPGGHRVYDQSPNLRLHFIVKSRKLGFPINEIRTLLTLVDSQNLICGDVKELTESHIKDIRSKIKALRKLENALCRLVAQCEGGNVPECHIIDTLWAKQN